MELVLLVGAERGAHGENGDRDETDGDEPARALLHPRHYSQYAALDQACVMSCVH